MGYDAFLKNKEIERWYNNVARGSKVTADVYLRRLGSFCKNYKIAPEELVKLSEKKLYNMLLDVVTEMEKRGYAGGYIESCLKAIKSWLSFNGIEIKRKIKIRNAQETPTLKDERVPTQDELRRIFLAGDLRERVACVFIAHAGLRLETLGNYDGTDGLRISDLPELRVKGKDVIFEKVPTLIRVRASLSKRRGEYLTFLSEEGCEYLREYLRMRLRSGERLTEESAILIPKVAKKQFISTINIGDIIRKPIRKAGFKWRPYVLRSFFATQLMLAESKGLVLRDYREFWMGHKGDIEHRYTLNKRLPEDLIEEMRSAYKRAQRFLQTQETNAKEDVVAMLRKQLLLVAGFKSEEIKEEQLKLSDEEFQELIRKKLSSAFANNGKTNGMRQKVASLEELDKYLEQGWEFVTMLPNNKAIIRLA